MEPATSIHTHEARPLWAYLSPVGAVRSLWAHRDLTWQLALRDIASRYRATRLGFLWTIITPLVMLAIYTFVFGDILGAKLQRRAGSPPPPAASAEQGHEGMAQPGTEGASKVDFALWLFCGLLAYNFFAEVTVRSPGVVAENPNYVKKLVFPIEVFIPAYALSSLITMSINYIVWGLVWVLFKRALPLGTAVYLPLALVPVCLLALGVGWTTASLGVFIRDLGHAVSLVVQMLFFLTPIIYEPEWIQSAFVKLIYVNPLTRVIVDVRGVLFWGDLPHWPGLALLTLGSAVVAQLGYAFFMKSKRAFADVL